VSYATPMRGAGRAHAYARLGLETQIMSASPVRLITLLLDGARAALAQARAQALQNNVAARGAAISKAIDIVETGLKASVDTDAGGAVASHLCEAYDLVVKKLLRANLKNDMHQLDGADQILGEIAAAWRSANDPQAAPQPAASAPSRAARH